MAASKFVIADVSWNAIAEVVLSNKKAAFAVKEKLSSSRWMLDLLKERGQCIELRRDMWLDMESLLNELENFCYSYDHEYYNSDYDMAKQIIFAYPEKRRRNRS